jgi:hypothetical protein
VQIEVKTKVRVTRAGAGEVVLTIAFLPRGSGNRGHVKRLGQVFRKHEVMGPHVKRLVCGASRLTVHLRPSLELMAAVNEIAAEHRRVMDVPGQLPLFGGAVG